MKSLTISGTAIILDEGGFYFPKDTPKEKEEAIRNYLRSEGFFNQTDGAIKIFFEDSSVETYSALHYSLHSFDKETGKAVILADVSPWRIELENVVKINEESRCF